MAFSKPDLGLLLEPDPQFLSAFVKGERRILGFTIDDLLNLKQYLGVTIQEPSDLVAQT
jgi:hypothetical protein